ncbi:hypothetical protein [Brytella acorum]|uniref:Uncharacterized protein n=1 Tax=Brytella acorum TaxID=2959299 RepID=A0AA35UZZ6_9PROT|nr:hypothetical protein [Brytella acorum]MDF3624862.1 hypothetical protein [Brytella acorum]CAI9120165.1 hypothetical protein LMG32879_000994 [Brytella acorum]
MAPSIDGERLIAFPGKRPLSPRDAARFLRISPMLFRVLRLLRQLPRPITINRKRFYNRQDLAALRARLLDGVGLGHRESRVGGSTFFPGGEPEEMSACDPLMVVLCRDLAIRRGILVGLWGMLLVGALVLATCYPTLLRDSMKAQSGDALPVEDASMPPPPGTPFLPSTARPAPPPSVPQGNSSRGNSSRGASEGR